MKNWEHMKPLSLDELRAELDKGIAQADAGLATSFDFDKLNAELDKLADADAAKACAHD